MKIDIKKGLNEARDLVQMSTSLFAIIMISVLVLGIFLSVLITNMAGMSVSVVFQSLLNNTSDMAVRFIAGVLVAIGVIIAFIVIALLVKIFKGIFEDAKTKSKGKGGGKGDQSIAFG